MSEVMEKKDDRRISPHTLKLAKADGHPITLTASFEVKLKRRSGKKH